MYANRIRLPETREEWLGLRPHSIGGSDIAGILGISRFNTPRDVYEAKVLPKDKPDTMYMRAGRKLEQTVADLFCEETGHKVYRSSFMYADPEKPYFTANIDRFIYGSEALLECKTTSAYNAEEWDGDNVPREYYAQVQWYMSILNRPAAYIAVLIGGNDFRIKTVSRDEEYIRTMRETAEEFWTKNVLLRIMPEPVAADKAGMLELRDAAAADGNIQEEPAVLSEALNARLTERQELKARVKELNGIIADIDAEILDELGLAETGDADGYIVTCKQRTSRSIDTKRLKEEKPEVYDEYAKTSTAWTINVKEKKNGK